MAVCQVCGKTNSEDARYCFSCGATLAQAPPVKVDVKTPIAYPTPGAGPTQQMYPSGRQVPKPGSCYYHADLPAAFVCARCGRSICVGCNRQYGVLMFCTECYWGLSSKIGYGGHVPEPYYQQPPPRSFF